MDENFYRAFEDKFRGSRELILSRLGEYLPFIEPLKELYEKPKAIDLGCGRGEWLELLNQNQFEAEGVDLDASMLKACHQLGFSVKQQDLMDCLKSLDTESQTIVSSFHVIEHVPFETLGNLIKEAFRVLKPCGLLILETPNTENLLVSSVNFYMDPTHQRPVPAPLLSFITEYVGFKRNKIVRLHENKELAKENVRILDVLTGVSPDYAVIAQKNGPVESTEKFNSAFNEEYGDTLRTMGYGYDQAMELKFSQVAMTHERLIKDLQTELISQQNRVLELEIIIRQYSTAPFRMIAKKILGSLRQSFRRQELKE